MVDDVEERLTRYRADLDTAVAADLARRHLASPETGSHDTNPLLLDTDHLMWLEPTMSAPQDRRRVTLAASLGVVAAVTMLLIVALMATRDNNPTPADQPSPTATVPTRAMSIEPAGLDPLAPGTYYADSVDGTPTPRIFATIGEGWRNSSSEGWSMMKADAEIDISSFDEFLQHEIGYMRVSKPVAVYSDACHWEDGYHAGPVDTVDGLVTALTVQQGWAELTTPSDISVDGYVGKAFQRTAPADMSDCSTRSGNSRVSKVSVAVPDIRSWDDVYGWGGYHEPGQIETLWVLDLDGTIVVISTGAWPEPSAGADADFAADVLDSIRIDRP